MYVTPRIFLVKYYYFREILLLQFILYSCRTLIRKELVIMFMVKDSRYCSICYTEVVQMSTNCCFVFPTESILQVSMSRLLIVGWFTDNKGMVAEAGSWQPYELHGGECLTLIKKGKSNFSHIQGNSEWSSCKVIYGLLIYD